LKKRLFSSSENCRSIHARLGWGPCGRARATRVGGRCRSALGQTRLNRRGRWGGRLVANSRGIGHHWPRRGQPKEIHARSWR
jgi:hypothetical protein